MTNVTFVGDIVESNGKTIKENNQAITHQIPIGTLVEITYESEYEEPEENTRGLRLFVVNHSRDCDGTPLYDLSFSLKAQDELEKITADIAIAQDDMEHRILSLLKWRVQGSILCHYGEESLKVIKSKG